MLHFSGIVNILLLYRYKSFAKQKKIELPLTTKKTFKYYAGVRVHVTCLNVYIKYTHTQHITTGKDSLGSTVMKALGPSTSHTIPVR